MVGQRNKSFHQVAHRSLGHNGCGSCRRRHGGAR
jgi:hypothetical protein